MKYQIKPLCTEMDYSGDIPVENYRDPEPNEDPSLWGVYEGESGALNFLADCCTEETARALVRGLQWEKYAEIVADIAWLAGSCGYHTGDSRLDIANFIDWTEQFEDEFNRKVEADEVAEDDYMEAVEVFALAKFELVK